MLRPMLHIRQRNQQILQRRKEGVGMLAKYA